MYTILYSFSYVFSTGQFGRTERPPSHHHIHHVIFLMGSHVCVNTTVQLPCFFRYKCPSFLLPSPRRYSLGWALAFWTICLHSSISSKADCVVSEQFSFYGVRLLASRPTPNMEDQGIPLRLAPTPWPVRHGWPYQSLCYSRHSSQGLRSTQTPPPR
jgi:hypothetical protein